YIQERLDALHGQFDLKYWPSLSDFLRELASDAEDAVMEATDPLTAAATMTSRPSRTDFIKALLAAIDENRGGAQPRPTAERLQTHRQHARGFGELRVEPEHQRPS